MSRLKRFHVCCFCGTIFAGYGNNPYPADKSEDARCCDYCNDTIVIPARIRAMIEDEDERND